MKQSSSLGCNFLFSSCVELIYRLEIMFLSASFHSFSFSYLCRTFLFISLLSFYYIRDDLVSRSEMCRKVIDRKFRSNKQQHLAECISKVTQNFRQQWNTNNNSNGTPLIEQQLQKKKN